jgi:cation:H+ antiporter
MIPGVDPVFVTIAIGLFLLAMGGDFLVRAAVSLARHLRVSPLLIGLTLVGFGTSTPELITSIQAALSHSPGIAVGNIVGSNIANILLILGLSAALAPVAVSLGASWRDGLFVILTALVLAWVSLHGGMTQQTGLLFLAALVLYVALAWSLERRQAETATTGVDAPDMSVALSLFVAVASLGILMVGAQLLVQGSISMARSFNISETFIGLTIVAVGTSLPELFTSILAALRRQGDISVGNILGSNIYNILGVGGATAAIHPITADAIPAQIQNFDNFIMLGASVLLVAWLILARGIGRIGGLVFLALYAAYIYIIHPYHVDGLQVFTDMLKPVADAFRAFGV